VLWFSCESAGKSISNLLHQLLLVTVTSCRQVLSSGGLTLSESAHDIRMRSVLHLLHPLLNVLFGGLLVAVFTNHLGHKMIRKDIIDALHPRIRIRVLFKPILIDPECVQKYLNHMGFAWKARWALAKIFTYDLLPSCFDWILQLDTDTIFRSVMNGLLSPNSPNLIPTDPLSSLLSNLRRGIFVCESFIVSRE